MADNTTSQNKIVYVDPNNLSGTNKYISNNPEDLSISVDMEVTSVSRYNHIQTPTYCMSWKSTKDEIPQTSFFVGKKIGGTNVLTDFYSNLSYETSKTFENLEGVGIESIEVDFDAFYLAQVSIKFIDVRGSSLFNASEYVYDTRTINSNNPQPKQTIAQSFFSCFFTFPYPLFKIQIKGFYGKAVTYDLYLVDCKIEFNAATGNFELNTKFIGYTYAFLSDIQFDLLVAAPYSKYYGSDYWASRNFTFSSGKSAGKSIPKLAALFTELCSTLGNTPKDLKSSSEGKNIEQNTALITKYENIISTWDVFKIQLSNIEGASRVEENTYKVQGNYIIFKHKDSVISYSNIKSKDGTVNYYGDFYNAYNAIKTDSSSTDILPDIFGVNTLKKDKNGYYIYNKTGEQITGTGFYKYTFDMSNEINNINNKLTILTSSNDNSNNTLVNRISSAIESQIGFSPTIYNIYETIFAHLETFANMFYKCIHKCEQRTFSDSKIVYTQTDVNAVNNSIMPAFPQFADVTGRDAWIGDEKNGGNGQLEEVKFVNGLLKALKYIATVEATAEANYQNGNQTALNYTPISFFDVVYNNSNPYSSLNRSNNYANEIVLQIVLRMFQVLYIDAYTSNVSYVNTAAKAEIENLNTILNNNIDIKNNVIKILNSLNNDLNYISNKEFISKINLYLSNSGIDNVYNISGGKTVNYSFLQNSFANIPYRYLPLKADISSNLIQNYDFKASNPTNTNLSLPYIASKDVYSRTSPSVGDIAIPYAENSYFTLYEEDIKIKIATEYNKFKDDSAYKTILSNWNITDKNLTLFFSPYSDETGYFVNDVNGTKIDNTTTLFNGIATNTNLLFNTNSLLVQDIKNNTIISNTELYKRGQSKLGKCYLFLNSLPFYKSLENTFNSNDLLTSVPKVHLLFLGSLIWRLKYLNIDPIKNIAGKYSFLDKNYTLFSYTVSGGQRLNISSKNDIRLDNLYPSVFEYKNNACECILREEIKYYLINYFINWSLNQGQTFLNIIENNKFTNDITKLLNETVYFPFPNKDYIQKYNGQDKRNLSYSIGNIKNYINKIYTGITTNSENQSNPDNLNEDPDSITNSVAVKKELYNTLKNINDKWFTGTKPGFLSNPEDYYSVSNFYSKQFIFIDKFYNNIGDDLIVNLSYFVDVMGQSTNQVNSSHPISDRSLYGFLTDLLVKHYMLFLPVPNFLNIKSVPDLESAFKPYIWSQKGDLQQTPFYVAMLVGQPSSKLNLTNNNSYTDDGLTVINNNPNTHCPVGTSDSPLPCFAVDYSVQNQSYFGNMVINMNNAVNTDQTIAAMMNLAGRGTGTPRLVMGNDFYSIYTTNSYQIQVEMLGDVQIQQLMYFQLMNIPMFRGCYIIYKVRHSITPGNMKTIFTGMRMSNIGPYINTDVFAYDQFGLTPVRQGIGSRGNLAPNQITNKDRFDLNGLYKKLTSVNTHTNRGVYYANGYSILDDNYVQSPYNTGKQVISYNYKIGDLTYLTSKHDSYNNFKGSNNIDNGNILNGVNGMKALPIEIMKNLITLSGYLEYIKTFVEKKGSLTITSGWRMNHKTDTNGDSYHNVGCAVDLQFTGISLLEVFNYISSNDLNGGASGKRFRITELFIEYDNTKYNEKSALVEAQKINPDKGVWLHYAVCCQTDKHYICSTYSMSGQCFC